MNNSLSNQSLAATPGDFDNPASASTPVDTREPFPTLPRTQICSTTGLADSSYLKIDPSIQSNHWLGGADQPIPSSSGQQLVSVNKDPCEAPFQEPEVDSADIKARLSYFTDKAKDAPRRLVEEAGLAWYHQGLLEESVPHSLQDALSCSGLYLFKNSINGAVILNVITARAEALAATGSWPSAHSEILAHTNALFLFVCMLLFDDDIWARTVGARIVTPLILATRALSQHMTLELEPIAARQSTLIPGAKDIWRQWMLDESTRRTIIMVFILVQVFKLLRGEQLQGCGSDSLVAHSFTVSASMWAAKDTSEFTHALLRRDYIFVRNTDVTEVIASTRADQLDDHAKIYLAGYLGVDQLRHWMSNRGEVL